jgi:hypothetical protein
VAGQILIPSPVPVPPVPATRAGFQTRGIPYFSQPLFHLANDGLAGYLGVET